LAAERDKLAAERDKLAAELESKNEEIKTLKESYNIMIELHASEKKKKKKKEMIQERHRQEVQGLYNQLAAVQDRVEAVRDVTNYHVADLQFAAFRGYTTASDSSAMLNSRPQDPPTAAGGPLPADRIFNFY
jgi:glutamine phosphoribosylpyrophosphate amidotransferase